MGQVWAGVSEMSSGTSLKSEAVRREKGTAKDTRKEAKREKIKGQDDWAMNNEPRNHLLPARGRERKQGNM